MLPKAKLLIHPDRMQLITELSSHSLTGPALAAALPSIPQASLYRHLTHLIEGGIVEVTKQDGQKHYRIVEGQARLGPDDLEGMSGADLLNAFSMFCSGLLVRVGQSIGEGVALDASRKGLKFLQVKVRMTDADLVAMNELIASVVRRSQENEDENSRAYTLAAIIIPEETDSSC